MCRIIFLLLSAFSIFDHASSFNVTNNNTSLPAHRRRMFEPVSTTLATIAAIATITSAALDVANKMKDSGAINAYGASIGIDNFFKYVDLQRVAKKVMDGKQSKTEEDPILGGRTGSGGVFSDESWYPGDGSAGIIRYSVTNPITSSKVYCFDYFWSSDSYQIGYTEFSGPPIALDANLPDPNYLPQLPGGIAIVISSERCNRDITQSFNDIKSFWVNKVRDSNNGNWDYQYSGYWPSSENGGSGNDAMIALTNREKQDVIKIGSDDFRVAMSASMTNNDATAIAIGIGPYKQIYGDDLYNQNDWFVFQQDQECTGGDETDLGRVDNVRECFKACQDRKGTSCNFLIFGKGNKYGNCYWESSCRAFEDDQYAVISVGGPDYQLWEYGVHCTSGSEGSLGNFNTVDECAAECKSQKGSDCKFFTFGIDNNKIGTCYWEESCTSTESGNYNVYVIKENTNIFDGKSVWKRKSIDFASFGSKQVSYFDLFLDVGVYGLVTLAVIVSAINIGCVILFKQCVVGKGNKTIY